MVCGDSWPNIRAQSQGTDTDTPLESWVNAYCWYMQGRTVGSHLMGFSIYSGHGSPFGAEADQRDQEHGQS